MPTHYAQFEDVGSSRDDRLLDALLMCDRLAAFFHADGYTELDWNARCGEAWRRATEDAA